MSRFITTRGLSKICGLSHRAVIDLVKKHYIDICVCESVEKIEMKIFKTSGMAGKEFLLTEKQCLFIITLMRNSTKIVELKLEIIENLQVKLCQI